MDLRNEVANDLNQVISDLKNWKANYSYVNENTPHEAQQESKQLVQKNASLQTKLKSYDKFIEEGRSLKYVKRYMALSNDYEKKKARYQAERGDKLPIFDDKPSAKQSELMWEMMEARDALQTFKENNP